MFKGFYRESSVQTYWPPFSPSKHAETASETNSPLAPFPPDCQFVERLRDRKTSQRAGLIKSSCDKEE